MVLQSLPWLTNLNNVSALNFHGAWRIFYQLSQNASSGFWWRFFRSKTFSVTYWFQSQLSYSSRWCAFRWPINIKTSEDVEKNCELIHEDHHYWTIHQLFHMTGICCLCQEFLVWKCFNITSYPSSEAVSWLYN